MNKLVVFAFFAASILAACGDAVENTTVNQTGVDVVSAVDDLPECTDENEGDMAFVKGESSARICLDGEWSSMDDENSDNAEFQCKTEELKDKSGIKIVCNGDSVGVILNGQKGEKGADGKDGLDGKQGEAGADGKAGTGCVISEKTRAAVKVVCGDSTVTIDLLNGLTALDSEKLAVSLDSLVGFTQKGPFLKGSTVFLYELSDGRTLKQTNGNFTSNIMGDDGRYKFLARDLVSQYAMVVVDGYYRNEVTGGTSDASIRLTALTDMRKRSSVNVNLLTHMEFDRVYYLVTRENYTVKKAKRQAQSEILNQFHIELDENTDAEDMNVFGASDADAALLAVSVLLQGDSSVTALSVLLSGISNDIAEYGDWKDSLTKARIADWAASADSAGRLDSIHDYVKGWGLGDGNVPGFEKVVRRFWSIENGLGVCGEGDNVLGIVKQVSNINSKNYYAQSYIDTTITKTRFICADTAKAKWLPATDIEKDTAGWGSADDGAIQNGQVNMKKTYVFQGGHWRLGTEMDSLLRQACLQDSIISDTVYKDFYYRCMPNVGGAIRGWEKVDADFNDTYENQGECKDGGVYSDSRILLGRVSGKPFVCDNGAFRHASDKEVFLNRGCTSYNEGALLKKGESAYAEYGYMCETEGVINPNLTIRRNESKFGILNDDRDGKQYYTIKVGNQTWMAENLNFDYKVRGGTYGSYCNTDECKMYGRYYTWAAAMDSAGTYSWDGRGCGAVNHCYMLSHTPRGICPEGWHLPTRGDWNTLYSAAGGSPYALLAIGFEAWGGASDASGFSAVPGGFVWNTGEYYGVGSLAAYWTSDQDSDGSLYSVYMWELNESRAYSESANRVYHMPIRCVKND